MFANKLPINIEDLLHQRRVESERIEYKASWNPEAVLHAICAFANDFHNLGSGYIVIGVREQNGLPEMPPVGLSAAQLDNIQKTLLNLGNSAIRPNYHPLTEQYEIQGKHILVLWVVGGENRPYKAKKALGEKNTDWNYYIRKHNSTVCANAADEQELISLAQKIPFDDRYCQQAALADLAPHLIREFLSEVGSGLAQDARHLPLETVAKQMNIVSGTPEMLFPKNVGLLFFNEDPTRFFPATQIDIVHFPQGTDADQFSEKTFIGPLGRITRDALTYIQNHYLHETVIKHPNRAEAERFWNYPYQAIEEAVVNAVYHRSYEEHEPIEIRITPEEITVFSVPGPDRSIRLEDLRSGKAVSRRYRNRRIGEFLKELDLTEGRSTVIPKILRVMQKNGSPEPQIETDDDRTTFLIRLPVHPKHTPPAEQDTDQDKPASGLGLPDPTDLDTVQATVQAGGMTEKTVLRLLEPLQHEPLSVIELLDKLSIKHRASFRTTYLVPALTQELIEMTLPDKPKSPNQKYRLTAKGRALLQRIKNPR